MALVGTQKVWLAPPTMRVAFRFFGRCMVLKVLSGLPYLLIMGFPLNPQEVATAWIGLVVLETPGPCLGETGRRGAFAAGLESAPLK